jgi:hypothetical protein
MTYYQHSKNIHDVQGLQFENLRNSKYVSAFQIFLTKIIANNIFDSLRQVTKWGYSTNDSVEKEPHSTFPFINIRFYSTIIS